MRASFIVLGLMLALPSGRGEPATGVVKGRVIVVENGQRAVLNKDVPAYVYLEQVDPKLRKARYGANNVAQIVHNGRAYWPHIVMVPTGTKIEFPVADSERHNAFSPTLTDVFDLGQYDRRIKPPKDRTFFVPGEIAIYCDMHKEMWAKVKVVESAWIAKVENETFTVPSVPPGTYKVVAWYRDSLEVRSDPITLKAGDTIQLPVELHIQAGKPAESHTRKDGSPYPQY